MKKINKLLLFVILVFSSFLSAEYTVIADEMREKIKSPTLQNIKCLKIKLDNGLEAIIVSDPEAKKSGAALSVGVGWNHEPYEHLGVAHFVEHMLFLGTEKYPSEKEYQEFIQSRGGMNNAYTSGDKTVYSFEINNEHISEALDRFSSFFVSPLFNESGLTRERKAVNQEFLYRSNIDDIRVFFVSYGLLDENSNASICRCGTEETLSNVSRDEIISWYENNYSSNIMRLALYSPLPIDELASQVDQCFSQIKNKNVEVTHLTSPLSQDAYLGKTVYVEPLKDIKKMKIRWELPEEFSNDLEYHTADLVSYVLAEESSRSLATVLKEKGLVHSFTCGQYNCDEKVSFFEMHISLTQEGLEEKEEVIRCCYEAISAFQKNGVPRYRFDEMVTLAKLSYQYQSRPEVFDYVQSIAADIQYENTATYPQKTLWPTAYHNQRAKDLLSHLQASKANYFIIAPGEKIDKKFDQTEKVAGVKFHIEDIPNVTLSSWSHPGSNNGIITSAPNPYIPNNLGLTTSQSDFNDNNVQMIAQSDQMKIYYQADKDYQLPKVNYNLFLLSPAFENTPQNMALADLYDLSLSETLCSHLELGGLAGLSSDMGLSSKHGYYISVSGYSQKAQLFLDKIIDQVRAHLPKEKDFAKYKDLLKRSYQNQTKQTPLQQSRMMMNSMVIKDYSTPEAKLAEINEISFEEFQSYCQSLFEKVYVKALIYGNINTQEADQFTASLEKSFAKSRPYKVQDHYKRAILDFDASTKPRYYTHTTDQVGSATQLMIGHGMLDHSERVAHKIMAKALSSDFYDVLRTKQQVGYLVYSFPVEYNQRQFTTFLTQSNSCSTRDLLSRYELFCEEFLASLGTEKFNEEKFNIIRESLITELSQPPVSIGAKGADLTMLAFEYEDFDRREKSISALKNLSFQEYIVFCYGALGRQNNGRIAVLIDGEMSSTPIVSYVPIENLSHFKAESLYEIIEMPRPLQEIKLVDE